MITMLDFMSITVYVCSMYIKYVWIMQGAVSVGWGDFTKSNFRKCFAVLANTILGLCSIYLHGL